jgi:hypothetical protein
VPHLPILLMCHIYRSYSCATSSSSPFPLLLLLLLLSEISFHISSFCELNHLRSVKSNLPAQRGAVGRTTTNNFDRSETSKPQDRRKPYIFLTRRLLCVAWGRQGAVCISLCFLMADKSGFLISRALGSLITSHVTGNRTLSGMTSLN